MKLVALERHLRRQGCFVIRDRGPHTIWKNPATNRLSAVPRHREINDFLARKICEKDLGIPFP